MADEIEDGGFAKIYGDRLEGSSLMECLVATRWCFLFMNSVANRSGFFRCANASVLARRANVTMEQAELAVQELESPDPDSTTPDNEGRRIIRVPGGWQIVTHQFYRNLRSSKQIDAAGRQQNKRERDREPNQPSRSVTSSHAPSHDVSPEAEAEGELEAEAERGDPDPAPADESDSHAFAGELVAEINAHGHDLAMNPGLSFAVSNLLACGHPKGLLHANGRAQFTRENLIDAAHGWIVAEAIDRWHRDERDRGSPFTFSRLVLAPDRLGEYAERGRGQWADWSAREHGVHGLEHERAPPPTEPADPEIAARHQARDAERLAKRKAWREEKPPAGLGVRLERQWWEEHARRRP